MMFGNRLKEARIRSNLKQSDFAKELGVKNTTISNWELGISRPDISMLEKISATLNVSVDYFFQSNKINSMPLNNLEVELIERYRKLDTFGKKQVECVINNEYYRTKDQNLLIKEKPNCYLDMVAKTEYLTGLSAGTGLFVFDDIPTETIMVPSEYNYIDFVISVSGDSMEPTYSDNDKVMILKQNQVNIGEIGVFMVDGNGYIKEFGSNGLLSHNHKYPIILFEDCNSIDCIGKVIGKIKKIG